MNAKQREILGQYLTDENIVIRTIEYPSGLSIDNRAVVDLFKVVYDMSVPERGETRQYIDWYNEEGSVKTEYKGVVNDTATA